MKLNDILKGIDCELRCPDGVEAGSLEVADLQFDSRRVAQGTLFVAQPGTKVDGHDFIVPSVEAGAVAVVCQHVPQDAPRSAVYVVVSDSSKALGEMAANFYGHPSRSLKLIGITGTNGKTTSVTLLHRMFRQLGHHVGLVSTIVNKIDEEELPTGHTTPDALELNQLLRRMADAGCDYCFMEVSSHAVVQHRIAGVEFAGAIFSNITHDHLDFHKTMANYIAAKKGFFDGLPATAWALVNIDDRNGRVMVQNTCAKVATYGLNQMGDFHCRILEEGFEGMHLSIDGRELWCRLVGRFNAYNLMAIYGAAVLCGIDCDEVLRQLSTLQPAPGRFQYVSGRGITAIVDYAHTPDALQNVLATINDIRRPQQMLITVVGCGGDRDRTKRPEMARIACEGSDKLVLTSDNPRTERPEAILDDMEAGLTPQQLSHTVRITDRRQAIRTACMMAREGDIVLIAGKGHEKYQEVNGVRSHFDDVEEAQKELEVKK
ncbi:MAG: UDP-N-acetylmuramoyl-L-alanyl-D-glutamate--2,6-diaminopimelate ligase [Bacteroidales bacterium]|nr:UDP-N-acetylmuramoyl-L-alanyl-D-glutamate--2,6-diaminopimelate ligase [Bacteroidales bacterium]